MGTSSNVASYEKEHNGSRQAPEIYYVQDVSKRLRASLCEKPPRGKEGKGKRVLKRRVVDKTGVFRYGCQLKLST